MKAIKYIFLFPSAIIEGIANIIIYTQLKKQIGEIEYEILKESKKDELDILYEEGRRKLYVYPIRYALSTIWWYWLIKYYI